jgi:hypothetical protein
MTFEYDFVDFGTRFKKEALKDTVVTDVGGTCLGHKGEELLIFDHHFPRENNFPSASAAVLHHVDAISSLISQAKIYLKTHKSPDFDALCSLYLVRKILEGEIQGPSSKYDKIDWYSPKLNNLTIKEMWPILLAAYASRVDNCKRIACRKESAIHSILYAGIARGRNWLDKDGQGAYDFFEDVKTQICDKELNPLYDDIFDLSSKYSPELKLLEREPQLYLQDLARARKCIVYIPSSQNFDSWYGELIKKELIQEDRKFNSAHLCAEHQTEAVDGLYLRDPESILFKEWAREDFENSTLGNGYTFTGIAYSNSKDNSKSRYYFSLDPEKALGKHLYPVWAKIQYKESLKRTNTEYEKPRVEYNERLENCAGAKDPWFDGGNFLCTIIDTPNSGSELKEGTKRDLSDDEVTEIVREKIEYNIYKSDDDESIPKVRIVLFPITFNNHENNNSKNKYYVKLNDLIKLPMDPGKLRLAAVKLKSEDYIETSAPAVAESIGKSLWPAIADSGVTTVPADFAVRHLWFDNQSVMVWNRHGIAIASKDCEFVKHQYKLLSRVAEMFRLSEGLAEKPPEEASEYADPCSIKNGTKILQEIIKLKVAAANPRNTVIRRLMDATEISSIIQAATSLHQEHLQRKIDQQQKTRDTHLQMILAIGTALGLLFAWNQVESLSIKFLTETFGFGLAPDWGSVTRLGLGLLLAVAFVLWFFYISKQNTKEK